MDVSTVEGLHQAREGSLSRLQTTWRDIIQRYNRSFEGLSDEIDLQTGEVVVDQGHLRQVDRRGIGGEDGRSTRWRKRDRSEWTEDDEEEDEYSKRSCTMNEEDGYEEEDYGDYGDYDDDDDDDDDGEEEEALDTGRINSNESSTTPLALNPMDPDMLQDRLERWSIWLEATRGIGMGGEEEMMKGIASPSRPTPISGALSKSQPPSPLKLKGSTPFDIKTFYRSSPRTSTPLEIKTPSRPSQLSRLHLKEPLSTPRAISISSPLKKHPSAKGSSECPGDGQCGRTIAILRAAPDLTLRQALFYTLVPSVLAVLQHLFVESGGAGVVIDFFGPVPGGTPKILVFLLDALLALIGFTAVLVIFQPLPPTQSSKQWLRRASRAMMDPSEQEEVGEEDVTDDSESLSPLSLPPTRTLLVISISSTLRRYWSVVYGDGDPTSSSSSSSSSPGDTTHRLPI
ncbi:centromere protein Scm3-domain-containing protein [Piptocephalis cylindrospora]|uniref:Centromere protein Scm3-domain-containing protein n=1 Tax=Piptocephalis cylindrospora TaxID=1907219 RepID=A0A4P9Y6S3_9FUNG|nr:centromere protein Scm3-domain-containing protein [Piptocephalis cylindrospora]|eukprot:RKP14767.1 centromere protein Scm3-domain-containing protein [Piptocephalis cylindrospora]